MSLALIKLKMLGGVRSRLEPMTSSLPSRGGSNTWPSTTYNGCEAPFHVPTPRINICGASLGLPLRLVTRTPVVCPWSANWGEACAMRPMSAAPTVEIDPVKSFLRRSPKPTTTTSSSALNEGIMVTSTRLWFGPTATCCVSKPSRLKASTPLAAGMEKLKFPLASVEVTSVELISRTVTPSSRSPAWLLTWPTTSRCCSAVASVAGSVFLAMMTYLSRMT